MNMIIKNPDPEQRYHCWHYCKVCGETFTHSQGDFDLLKNCYYKCCLNNLVAVSTKEKKVAANIPHPRNPGSRAFAHFAMLAKSERYTQKVVGDNCYRKLRRKNGKYQYIRLVSAINGEIKVTYFEQ